MPALFRQLVVLLVATSQAMLGAHAGGIICWGSVGQDVRAAEVGCCHAQPAQSVQSARLPAPVAPQHPADDHDDCPCIDAAAPIARVDSGSDPAPLPLAAAAPPCAAVVAPPAPSQGSSQHRPPGPAPGLRTIRLLI